MGIHLYLSSGSARNMTRRQIHWTCPRFRLSSPTVVAPAPAGGSSGVTQAGAGFGDDGWVTLVLYPSREKKRPSSSRVCRGQHSTAHGRARFPPRGPMHWWAHISDGRRGTASGHGAAPARGPPARGSGSPPSVVPCRPLSFDFVVWPCCTFVHCARRVPGLVDYWTAHAPRASARQSAPKMHQHRTPSGIYYLWFRACTIDKCVRG